MTTAEKLAKYRLKVEVERDAKQWPVSVVFRKHFGNDLAILKVMREHEERVKEPVGSWGPVEDKVAPITVIQGTMRFIGYDHRFLKKFEYTVEFADKQHDTIKEVIWNVDKNPISGYATSIEMLIPALENIRKLAKEGKFVDYMQNRCTPQTAQGAEEEAKAALEMCTRIFAGIKR